MLSGVEFYRRAFEHEVDANHAMLKMLGSVPKDNRSDPRFQQAVNIAAHMTACRQNFLDVFKGVTEELEIPFAEQADFEKLKGRFAAMESAWTDYLSQIDDSKGAGNFEFVDNGRRWRMNLEAQLFQLVGHAAYHRGQVVLLADALGGTTFDTDYIEWFTQNHPEGWSMAG